MVGDYTRPKCGQILSVVHIKDTSRQISELLADEYGIVYMDFKKDVELMLRCLKESGKLDARAYHGGLSHIEKIVTSETKIFNCLWLQSLMKLVHIARMCTA